MGTMINAFDVRLMIKFRLLLIIHLELHVKGHFKDLYKDPVGAPEIVLKGSFQVALEFHLFMQLSI